MSGSSIAPAQSGPDYAHARELFEEYALALGIDLQFQGFSHELHQLTTLYAPPTGCLLLATAAQQFVGCVGVRRMNSADCELKRLYVRPRARGGGLGRRLSEAAIEQARALGYQRLLLDTLASMRSARALYQELGFVPIAAYYDNPIAGTSYLALDLTQR